MAADTAAGTAAGTGVPATGKGKGRGKGKDRCCNGPAQRTFVEFRRFGPAPGTGAGEEKNSNVH